MRENDFWKVCEVLDNPVRIGLLKYLLSIEKSEFPCVVEIAERFGLGVSATSGYLKRMSDVGLVASKRADKRVYYRAFPTDARGLRVVASLGEFFNAKPNEERMRFLSRYIHALSHYRRNSIVRCLAATPGLELKEISLRTDIPYPTVDRLLEDLNRARIVDLNGNVIRLGSNPEDVLLDLTLE